MKNGKLKYIFCYLLLLLSIVSSCDFDKKNQNTISITKKLLSKKWVLANERGKLEKGLATHVILSLEKTGYFLVYDTIIDKRFVSAGISKIQPISKGQWKLVENKLILTHLLPNVSHSEVFKINLLESDILITEDKEKIKHTYIYINN
jgi:hypothetical protein